MTYLEVLVIKLCCAVYRRGACAVSIKEIASLNHETFYLSIQQGVGVNESQAYIRYDGTCLDEDAQSARLVQCGTRTNCLTQIHVHPL
jgi:hypothetical protein